MLPSAAGAPPRSKRRYQHFCPAARALEMIGEKWSLLIVRDLLAGPRRFSELRRSLAAITPKWLSARLRALEADGIVTREGSGEREVGYRLTPRGQALEPVFDALLVWGMDHALGPPRHGEAIHPGRVIDATVRYLARRGMRTTRRRAWVVRFGADRSYTIRFDGTRWTRQRGEAAADVVVQTSPEEWVKFLSADAEGRRRWLRRQRARGTGRRLDELASAFGPVLETAALTAVPRATIRSPSDGVARLPARRGAEHAAAEACRGQRHEGSTVSTTEADSETGP
jgi:DNA-binding HxlR family transcriptional regulator